MARELERGLLPALQELGLPGPDADPLRPRLTLVFDREGWSPELFERLRQQGVAVVTWRKGPQEAAWPDADFRPAQFELQTPLGTETAAGRVADKPVTLGRAAVPAREIRFSLDSGQPRPGRSGQPRQPRALAGHPAPGRRQAALVTTHPTLAPEQAAALLRSRWSQENFFKYLRLHFALDAMHTRHTDPVHPDTRVVHPGARAIDSGRRRLRDQLGRLRNQLARLRGRPGPEARDQRADLRRRIAAGEQELEGLATARQRAPGHLPAGDLEGDLQLRALPHGRHLLLNGLKMIAYRAETALAAFLAPACGKPDEVRALARSLLRCDACLQPDAAAGTLQVRLPHLPSRAQDEALEHLLGILNASETTYPGTALSLVYRLGPAPDDPQTMRLLTVPSPASGPTNCPPEVP